MAKGYVISERDCARVKNTVRRVERMVTQNSLRRFPVFSGGGMGMPIPNGHVEIFKADPETTLVKETHESKYLYLNPNLPGGGNIYLKMPVDPSVEDAYFFWGPFNGGFNIYIRPNTGQLIQMPSQNVTDAQKISFGGDPVIPLYGGTYQMLLICSASKIWTCWYTTTSIIV